MAKAEFSKDRLGITNPVERRLNVLMRMRQHFLSKGDRAMYPEMKAASLDLRNSGPSTKKLVAIDGQSLKDLLKRLRVGQEWLTNEHTLWP